jgi:TatA/E family protein of Tat protein translocase
MGIGPTQLLIILLIVVLIFGAGKLPALGAGLREAYRPGCRAHARFSGNEEEALCPESMRAS